MQTAEGGVAAPRAIVSPALFQMLDVPPVLGRTLIAEDERPGATAAVMSAAAWQRFFASDPAVLGRSVTLNGTPFTIVGVMPTGFDYPERSTMFWTPLAPSPDGGTRAFGNFVARLSPERLTRRRHRRGQCHRPRAPDPDASRGLWRVAGAGTTTATSNCHHGRPAGAGSGMRPSGRDSKVLSVKELIVSPIRPALAVLGFAVVLVLLIVCANVANLLLARGTSRHREIGVRLAIGAGRGRIVRQIVTESVLLSLIGGLAGTIVAMAGVQLVKTLATIDTPRLFQLSINLGNGSLLPRIDELRVESALLLFATAIATLSGVIFGLAPAISMSRINYVRTICAGTATRSDGSHPSRVPIRGMLVVAQVGHRHDPPGRGWTAGPHLCETAQRRSGLRRERTC